MLRTARPALFTLLAIGATLAASHPARADVAPTNVCDAKAFECASKGSTNLHVESRAAVMSSIGTGWMPACAAPDANGHCSDEPIQVSASIDLAAYPGPSTEPLWMVDMVRTAVVSAAWPTPQAFELTLPTATTNDGTFKVSHTLIPAVRVYANILGFKNEWLYDASRFVTENAANFAYRATNSVTFAPWAFEQPSVNVVPAPALASTTLFTTKLVKNADYDVDLALAATTSPTFSYRTTKVTLADAPAITLAARTAQLAMRDADFLELPAEIEGEVTVTGELTAAPYVSINKIAGINVPGGLGVLDLTNLVNAPKKAYEATPAVAVKFPRVTIRVPLPNVKAPKTADLGAVQVGQKAEKTLAIANTGELGAKMTVESSDPQFTVDASALTVDAKGTGTLTVRFVPTKEGAQSATLTVRSNDPDAPVQTIAIQGGGAAIPAAPGGDPAPVPEPATEPTAGGCGCRTVGPTGATAHAGLAGLGLALVLAARRRRTAR